VKVCEYGCGQEAKHQLLNNVWCCSTSHNSCPVIKKKNSESKKGVPKPKTKMLENIDHKLCEYGCGQEAKFKFSNGKICCSVHVNKCPYKRAIESEIHKGQNWGKIGKPKAKRIENIDHKLCEYGCDQEAHYQFLNGRLSCSEYIQSCPSKRKINGRNLIGKPRSEEVKKRISKTLKGIPKTEEHKKKAGMKHRYSIEQWTEKYPTFGKAEEMRYHPETGEIQVHCKNHDCLNSKEQGGWFTPFGGQFQIRIEALELQFGSDGGYFYCCDECKITCPLYNLRGDPFRIKELLYTPKEYEIFKQEVLKKDKYICHFCGENKAEHVHHTRPQKLEPFFALDPDYAISVCAECHYFIHRAKDKGGICSNGELANTICAT
jgi:hypothetical protein